MPRTSVWAVMAGLAASSIAPGLGTPAIAGTVTPRVATVATPITVTMPAPSNATISNAQYSSQDVYAGVVTGVATPPSGISPLQRLANLNPPNFRIHAGTDGGLTAINLPFPAAYTSTDSEHVAAWDFTNLDSMIANTVGRTSGSTMLNVRYAPDSLFAGSGPMGGNGNAQGALLDQSYAAFATYMGNLVKYYNTNSPPAGAFPARPAGVGPIKYWEIWNEPDFSSENPRMPPTLPPPTGVTLTAVSVAGGTLTGNTTYSYRITPLTSTNQEGLPSAVAAITLPASGANAVQISWNPSVNLGRVSAAYQIYGRSGTLGQLVVVGKDNSAGLSWTDKGTITKGGGPPGSDSTLGGPVFSPLEYKALWDQAVPAMKAVDPTIKVVGPAATNPISIGPTSVITTVVTTGPADSSYLDNRDFVQVLMTSSNQPDVISYHGYGGYQGSADSNGTLMSAIPQMAADVLSNIVPYVGTTPVWHTEANVNSADDTTNRPATAFGAAWDASLFANLAPIGVSTIHQYTYVNSATFGLITEPGSAVAGAVEGNPYLPYWVEYAIGHLFAPGAKILPVANVPAGFDVLAVANPPDFSKVKVLVVNRQLPATNTAVSVQLAGASSLATRQQIIDSATNLVNGPSVSNLGAVQLANLQMNGFSVALAEFDTAAGPPPTPTVSSVVPNSGPTTGGTSVTINGTGFTGTTSVSFGATPASSFTVINDGQITATSPAGTGTVDVTVTTPGGTSATGTADHFTYRAPNPITFYFAEGFTATGFTETLSLFMPNQNGTATIDYYLKGSHIGPISVSLTAGQTKIENVNADVGVNQEVSARVILPEQGVVERAIHFTFGAWRGSTDIVGATSPSTEWNFAEGSTYNAYSEYLTLQNPNGTAVDTTLNYFLDSGAHPIKHLSLPPNSRTTVEVLSGDLASENPCVPGAGGTCGVGGGHGGVSVQVVTSAPIVAERPMYVNGFSFGQGAIRDGHVVFGAPAAGGTWYFAEGTTLNGFNEFLTIENPGTSTAAVALRYMDDQGVVTNHSVSVAPQSRSTILVNDPTLGVGAGHTGVSVRVTSPQPIVVERPMYMVNNFGTGSVNGAHDVMGATALGTLVGFGVASTVTGENDFLTIQNPNGVSATVTLTYYPGGTPIVRTFTIPPNTRHTVRVYTALEGPGPGFAAVGIVVSSTQPILVEKPTYSSNASTYGATDTAGYPASSF